MFWREKKVEYSILIPPLSKPIEQLSKDEAQVYFDWFIGKLDERVNYLQSYTKLKLDYSPGSLIYLWKWFLKTAEIEITPAEHLAELERSLATSSIPFSKAILADKVRQFSLETEYIIRDIGMYLGEVFVKNYPQIFWGFYNVPKADMFVNHPLVLGFPNEIHPQKSGPPFEPIHMTNVQAARLLRGNANSDDLFRIYRIWAEKLREY